MPSPVKLSRRFTPLNSAEPKTLIRVIPSNRVSAFLNTTASSVMFAAAIVAEEMTVAPSNPAPLTP
ncbi:MAG TPA: hypothetical protein DEF68_09510 [Elusimicrobia bacterium]|nr:hypothetical protein [Elusimicrobiota bacterium]